MKKKIAGVMAAVLASVGVAVFIAPQPAYALGKIKCDVLPTGGEDNDGDVALFSGAFDPIVYHNVESEDPSEAQPHVHDFFGTRFFQNTGDINASWYTAIRNFAGGGGADATSCRLNSDTAGYWAPALVYTSGPNAGQRVKVQQFTAYYRGFAGQTTHAGTDAIPKGARLVAKQDGSGYGISGWNCGQNSQQAATQGPVLFIPDCTGEDGSPGNTLTAHINFPSCWDGQLPNHPGDNGFPGMNGEPSDVDVYGDTRDNNYGQNLGPHTGNHFIYPTNKTACPASHPHEVSQLRETIQYDYQGNGSDVALTSDIHDGVVVGQRGSSMHVDFWNTWDQTAFVDFVQRCIKTAAEANCDL